MSGNALVQVQPARPDGLIQRGELTSETQLNIVFDAQDQDGGASIDFYSVEISDDRGVTFVEAGTPALSPAILTHSKIVSGQLLHLRYRCHNVHGYSEYSEVSEITAATVSQAPSSLKSVHDGPLIRFEWEVLTFTGGNNVEITAYRVEIQTELSGLAEIEDCFENSLILPQPFCEVPMALLKDFGFEQSDTIAFRAAALNLVGWSEWSQVSTDNALMADKPHQLPNTPTRDDILTTDELLKVEWLALEAPLDGGDQILSYNLQFDNASGGQTWINLVGFVTDSIELTFSHTNSIQKGKTYQFKVRARNAQGWGPFSEVLSLVAARRPDQMPSVVTSNEFTDVKIAWEEPAYDGGSPLLGFRVQIKTAEGFYEEETEHCDGIINKANLFCVIPMSALRSEPFSL